MPVLTARDGTRLAYQVSGEGTPVVCLPGGPLQDSASLGGLGGLSGPLRLIRPDYRGTGRSETPISAASYRCDALVDDVEALREHLRHDQVDVLAHCAGANLAVQYAARHSWLDGRATEERPPWGYARLVAERLPSRYLIEARRGPARATDRRCTWADRLRPAAAPGSRRRLAIGCDVGADVGATAGVSSGWRPPPARCLRSVRWASARAAREAGYGSPRAPAVSVAAAHGR
ncbi:MAG: alpha/beta fold hydrolase [Nocardioidaceae bacterium]|nr:alpha/beta fold hydrolase [Nocardioidaceae bacterium]